MTFSITKKKKQNFYNIEKEMYFCILYWRYTFKFHVENEFKISL